MIRPRRSGLFSNVLQVLGLLDRFPDRIPLVDFTWRRYLYWSELGWDGSRNAWEYYFEPLSPYRLADIVPLGDRDLASMDVDDLAALADERTLVTDAYPPSKVGLCGEVRQEHRQYLHDLARRWIRPRDAVVRKVDEFRQARFGRAKVVGIHYRSTDKIRELVDYVGLPETSIRGIDDYLDAAEAAVRSRRTLYFLATEDRSAVARARRRLGRRLVYTNATRVRPDTRPPHRRRSLRNPALGEEALIDSMLLATCSHLVHGMSNLSWYSLILNPTMPNTDLHDLQSGAAGQEARLVLERRERAHAALVERALTARANDAV